MELNFKEQATKDVMIVKVPTIETINDTFLNINSNCLYVLDGYSLVEFWDYIGKYLNGGRIKLDDGVYYMEIWFENKTLYVVEYSQYKKLAQ